MVILENIDIDKANLKNIDIDKISNRLEFGISNTPSREAFKCEQCDSSSKLWFEDSQ